MDYTRCFERHIINAKRTFEYNIKLFLIYSRYPFSNTKVLIINTVKEDIKTIIVLPWIRAQDSFEVY